MVDVFCQTPTTTTSRRLETDSAPGRPPPVGWTFTLLAAGSCKPEQATTHVPDAPRPGFSESSLNLADRVLQPADRGLQLAFRLVGAAFGLLLVRLCGPIVGCRSRPQLWDSNSLMARPREASRRPPYQRDPDRSRPSDGTAGC